MMQIATAKALACEQRMSQEPLKQNTIAHYYHLILVVLADLKETLSKVRKLQPVN